MTLALVLIGVLVSLALVASVVGFAREKSARALLRLLGSLFLGVVVLTHVAEAFDLFPSMGWGRPDSPGHYIDLVSAIVGLILFVMGSLPRRLVTRGALYRDTTR